VGYYLFHSKSTELWIRTRHHHIQALKVHQEAAYAKILILTQESAVMALYGRKALEEQEELNNENAK
jgi:hypothetical protein